MSSFNFPRPPRRLIAASLVLISLPIAALATESVALGRTHGHPRTARYKVTRWSLNPGGSTAPGGTITYCASGGSPLALDVYGTVNGAHKGEFVYPKITLNGYWYHGYAQGYYVGHIKKNYSSGSKSVRIFSIESPIDGTYGILLREYVGGRLKTLAKSSATVAKDSSC
jgi:hypothetical protein